MALLPPSTAEVIEFRCQFSHNITQKRKKWNDGSLKFHTFNKLVRIFDDDFNDVGQKHWQGDALQDGDEFLLDNVLVSVQEQLRSTQTNLAPLFDRRKKQPANEGHGLHDRSRSSQASRANTQGSLSVATSPLGISKQMHSSAALRPKHTSLNCLLGTPKGLVGKAVAHKSPFEVRNSGRPEYHADEPALKRSRTESSNQAPWVLTTTTKHIASRPSGSAESQRSTIQRQAPRTATKPIAVAGQKAFNTKSVIDLTSDTSTELLENVLAISPGRRDGSLTHCPMSKEHLLPIHDALLESQAHIAIRDAHAGNTQPSGSMGPPRPRSNARHLNRERSASRRLWTMSENEDGYSDSREEHTNSITLPSGRRNESMNVKSLALSTAKRKSMLVCMQKDTSLEPEKAESTVDVEIDELTKLRRRKQIREAYNHDLHVISDPVLALNSPPFAAISSELRQTPRPCGVAARRAESSPVKPISRSISSEPGRVLLRDIVQRSNQHIRQQAAIMSHKDEPRLSPQRGALGRSQSDPSAIASSIGLAHKGNAQSSKRQSRGAYSRVKSAVSAYATAFEAPTTIFSQLPPERDLDREDLGPWSREAFDLFDWRPPDWEDRLACKPSTIGMVD